MWLEHLLSRERLTLNSLLPSSLHFLYINSLKECTRHFELQMDFKLSNLKTPDFIPGQVELSYPDLHSPVAQLVRALH